jgi:hypothetical protein
MSANGFPRNRSGSVHQNQSRGNSFIEDPTANGGPGTGSGSGPNPTRRRSSLGPEDLYTIEEIVEDSEYFHNGFIDIFYRQLNTV